MKRVVIGALLVFALVTGATRPAPAFLDKTRFLLHLGVAYFAFHHWVLKPYEQGDFASGAPHRVKALVKGGVALLFAVHEVHVAEKVAAHSKDPLLQKLAAGLAGLTSSFSSVGERLKSGQFNPSDIQQLDSQTGTLQSAAQENGTTIKDVPAAIPGT
jgi:hypothetical protein